jgi:hypothetical protein
MSKQMVTEIGYAHYVIDAEDAVVLMGIAQRMTRVEQAHWRSPWQPAEDQSPFVEGVRLADVDMSPPQVESPEPEIAAAPPPSDLIRHLATVVHILHVRQAEAQSQVSAAQRQVAEAQRQVAEVQRQVSAVESGSEHDR